MKHLTALLALISLLIAPAAYAQSTATPSQMGYLTSSGCSYGQTTCFVQYGGTVPISGTISASFAQFAPISPSVSLTAGAASTQTAFTAGGTTVQVTNQGTNPVYLNFGTSAAVTATATSPMVVPAGSAVYYGIGSNTNIAVIDPSAGADKVIISSGSGGGAGFGGGGGGGGSSGAVFGPTADGSPAANPPVLVGGTNDGTGAGTVGVAKVSTGGLISVDGSAVTQPISAVALPLPTGAATAAGLTTINTTLGSPMQATGGSVTVDGSNGGALQSTTNNALEPPTAASGKITAASVAVSANTSTTIVAANANRIAISVQCSVACKVSETGATLTSATQISTEGGVVIAAGGYFIPPLASRTAFTVYMGGAGVVSYTDYSR